MAAERVSVSRIQRTSPCAPRFHLTVRSIVGERKREFERLVESGKKQQKRAMTLRIIGYLLVMAGVCLAAFGANSPEDVPKVINQIAAIEYEKSATKAIRLLEQLESFDFWGIGGGRGPTDRSSLSISVLTASRSFMSWDLNPHQVPDSSSPRLQSWLKAEPSSAEMMLSMLEADDPLPRWISLAKLRATGAGEPVLLGKVQELAMADRYFVIGRKSAATPDGSEHVFEVPLRQMAIEILKAAERPAPSLDYNDVARQGLHWLGECYLARRSDKLAEMGIVGALRQLAPKTPEIVAAQAALAGARTPEAVLAVFEELVRGGATFPETRVVIQPPAASATRTTQVADDSMKSTELLTKHAPQPLAGARRPESWTIGLCIVGLIAAIVLILRSRR